jgi:hypothetical protein
MTEWWTYRLSDFLMFSPRTYWRLVELYNRELWPGHFAGFAAGLFCVVQAWRGRSARLVPGLLALAWLWSGWGFHWQRYADINWGAQYLAAAFGVQAVLLLAAGALHAQSTTPAPLRHAGLVLAVAGLAYPLVTMAVGRPWVQAESFVLMPDPTALVTLGVVLMLPLARAWRLVLALIPVLSLLAGAATHWAMAG